jgi:hypothetical protein
VLVGKHEWNSLREISALLLHVSEVFDFQKLHPLQVDFNLGKSQKVTGSKSAE